MTDTAEKEEAAEMLLEAKGFSNVVVSITDDSADVVLDMGKDATDAKRAQVEDIVKRKNRCICTEYYYHSGRFLCKDTDRKVDGRFRIIS